MFESCRAHYKFNIDRMPLTRFIARNPFLPDRIATVVSRMDNNGLSLCVSDTIYRPV
jgi:hypothetical protein